MNRSLACAVLTLFSSAAIAQVRVPLAASVRLAPAAALRAPLSASASVAAQAAPSAVSTAESLGALSAEPERLAPAVAEAADGSGPARARSGAVDASASRPSAAPSLSPSRQSVSSEDAGAPRPIEYHSAKALQASASFDFVVKTLAFIAAAASAALALVIGVPGALMVLAGYLQSQQGLIGVGLLSVVVAAVFYLVFRHLNRRYLKLASKETP